MDKKTVIKEALGYIFKGINQIADAIPEKAFTIDGRLVGDIGEVIAASDYGIKLYPTQKARHDGETADGRKVQIKATFKNSLTFKTIPDYYLGFKLFKPSEKELYKEIFNGPGKIIFEKYKNRKGIGKTLLSFPVSELEKLSSEVPTSERIKKLQKGD